MRHRRVGALSLVQTRVERPLRDVDDEVGEDDEQRDEHVKPKTTVWSRASTDAT